MGGIAMWIVRDKCGELWLHVEKPKKIKDQWCSTGEIALIRLMDKSFFSEVKWEDEEPRELILK